MRSLTNSRPAPSTRVSLAMSLLQHPSFTLSLSKRRPLGHRERVFVARGDHFDPGVGGANLVRFTKERKAT